MEPWNTVKRFKNWVEAKFTAKVSVGQRFEQAAVAFLQREYRFKILKRNSRIGGVEVDILAFCKREQILYLVEVRGRISKGYQSVEMLGYRKLRRLERAALFLRRGSRFPVRVWLVAVYGDPWGNPWGEPLFPAPLEFQVCPL